MDNIFEDNLTYGVSELAKRSNVSIALSKIKGLSRVMESCFASYDFVSTKPDLPGTSETH